MRAAAALALAVLGACGRVGFGVIGPAGGGDANTASDATDDAIDAPAVPFCASMPTATFCRDFDEGNGINDWVDLTQFNGTVQIDSVAGLSPPASLWVDTTAIGTGAESDAFVDQPNVGVAAGVSATLAIWIDSSGTGDAVLCEIYMDDGNRLHTLELVARDALNPAYVEDSDQPSGGGTQMFSNDGLAPLAPGMWHHIDVDYTSGASAMLVIKIDGVPVLSRVPMFTTAGQVKLELGVPYLAGPSTPWQVHLDDFAVTLR
jgi:hypothetical protein